MGKKVIIEAASMGNISFNLKKEFDLDQMYGEGWEMSAQIKYDLDQLAEEVVWEDVDVWWTIVEDKT